MAMMITQRKLLEWMEQARMAGVRLTCVKITVKEAIALQDEIERCGQRIGLTRSMSILDALRSEMTVLLFGITLRLRTQA